MAQSFAQIEIGSQPDMWRRAKRLATTLRTELPEPGEHVAVVGCGTSWFMAQSYAALREARGLGVTDAFAASEMPRHRRYDRVLAITRSGTTTEVLRLLDALEGTPSTVLTGVPKAVGSAADKVVDLSWCDEKSVVQTRFATTTLALLRAHLGDDLSPAIRDAEEILTLTSPESLLTANQFTFLGSGWTVGLAHEAALKLREAATAWAESYPALEYRHGPLSIAEPGRVTWILGATPPGLPAEVAGTGATFVQHNADPMADLVRAQRLAVALAQRHDVDPDNPRHLTRSVVLENA